MVRAFTGGMRGRRKVAEIAATHNPDDEDPEDRVVLPPKKRPHNIEHVDLGTPPRSSSGFPPPRAPPQSSSGLPPRAPPRSNPKVTRRAPVDPLLHTSIVTPPCPILPEEEVTPLEERCYSHVSGHETLSSICTSLEILYVLSCKAICT